MKLVRLSRFSAEKFRKSTSTKKGIAASVMTEHLVANTPHFIQNIRVQKTVGMTGENHLLRLHSSQAFELQSPDEREGVKRQE